MGDPEVEDGKSQILTQLEQSRKWELERFFARRDMIDEFRWEIMNNYQELERTTPIVAQDLAGKVFTVKVNLEQDTGFNLRVLISGILNDPVANFRLFHRGYQMDPTRKLKEYNIEEGSMIYLIYQIKDD